MYIICVRNCINPVHIAQWSLYVPHSGHYMYRTVVTICTTQWSLYVPPSGHYMYRTVVTICTAQWSLYVPHSGHYMYRPVVTICTASLTFNNSTFCPHSVFMCFVWIWEQTAGLGLYISFRLIFVLQVTPIMAPAFSRRPHSSGPGSIPGQSVWDLRCTEWHWDRFFSKNFSFPLSISFHHCSILIHSSSTHVV